MGLIPVAGGIAGLLCIMATGLGRAAELPDRVTFDWNPKILVTGGPYALSRNPMYLAEFALWLGWALFYGSIVVALALVGFAFAVRLVVQREERDMERHFGEAYRQYRRRVPRWLATNRRRP